MRKHLLSGFVYCVCGNKMSVASRANHVTRYVCRKIDHEGRATGCGKVSRARDPLEYLIVESVLYRLDSPELEQAVNQQPRAGHDDQTLSHLMAEQQAQQARLQEIAEDYATTKIDKAEYTAFKTAATTRLVALQREISAKMDSTTPMNLPADQSVRSWWEAGDMAQQRHVLSLLIDRVVVHPSPGVTSMTKAERFAGRWQFKPEHVQIDWRV